MPVTETLTREIFGNIDSVSKTIFYAVAGLASGVFAVSAWRRVRRWNAGQPDPNTPSPGRLLRNVLLNVCSRVLSQATLSKTRPAASAAHRCLFAGFAVLTLGTILIAIEHVAALLLGRTSNDPVFHKGLYFAIFEPVMDLAGLALLLGTGWFLLRRRRTDSSIAHQTSDWFVLAALMFLGASGFLVEGLRIIEADSPGRWVSFVGAAVAGCLETVGINRETARGLHQVNWWLHAVVALGLIAAVPSTRLWHAVAGSVLLGRYPKRQLGTLDTVSIQDVETTGVYGISQLEHLAIRQLVSLEACVSCGRCEDECPAHAAGKPLSPRNVVQDLARQLPAIGFPNAPLLAGDVVSEDTLWSCTACSACVEVCPLGVDPLELIIGLRRHLVGSAAVRGSAATTLGKLGRSGNPWGLPAEDRVDWAQGLDVPTVEQQPDFDVLYWVGCAAAYDRQSRKTARAMVRLMQAANVKFAVLGERERCTGESARRMGEEFVFAELAAANVAQLNKHNVTRIVTHCPHCLNSLKHDYPDAGGHYQVVHHSEFLNELIQQGRLHIDHSADKQLTFHDPCYLARVNGIVDAPRDVLKATGARLEELPRHGCRTACCGGGGGRMWLDDSVDERIGRDRIDEITESEAETVVVACPFCRTMIGDGLAAQSARTNVVDLAEVLVESLEESD
jgi:Fe-S oxidoreductase/nitrate reductase gamma subunit